MQQWFSNWGAPANSLSIAWEEGVVQPGHPKPMAQSPGGSSQPQQVHTSQQALALLSGPAGWAAFSSGFYMSSVRFVLYFLV